MTHIIRRNDENENSATNDVPVEIVELSDGELASVAGGYMIAGPAGQLDWWKRQLYYHQHPGMMQPLVTAKQ